MKTKKFSGIITIKGSSKGDGDWWNYSMIEIGDKIIKDVCIPRPLDVFIKLGEKVKLLVWEKAGKIFVILIQREDGKAFYANGKKPGTRTLIFGIALTPIIIGFGILLGYLINKISYNMVENAVSHFPNRERLPLIL